MARLNELWRSVDGPGRPPCLNSRCVKARVNAALDACHTERKTYMKQKWRAALAAAVTAAVITGTAFAATMNWEMLTAWFKGDTTPGQEYVDNQVRSVSDENYTLTIENSAADGCTVYMTVTITALSDVAKEFIHGEGFNSIDTFDIYPISDGDGPDTPDAVPEMDGSFSIHELSAPAENARRFALEVDSFSTSARTLRIRCGYMEMGKVVEVPIVPAASVTVKIGASGTGVLQYLPAEAVSDTSLTIQEITLSPFTCCMKGKASTSDIYPNIRFRMTDGSVFTQSQAMDSKQGRFSGYTGQWERRYRFKEVQDLGSIASVIVFDMEYPLDGSTPTPVEYDAALEPFTVMRMEALSGRGGYSIPIQELTEKLGGTYTWDAADGSAVCEYRGVDIVLRPGSSTALVDEQEIEMSRVPAEQGGILAADHTVFEDAWGIDCKVQRENIRRGDDLETVWHDWYIIP